MILETSWEPPLSWPSWNCSRPSTSAERDNTHRRLNVQGTKWYRGFLFQTQYICGKGQHRQLAEQDNTHRQLYAQGQSGLEGFCSRPDTSAEQDNTHRQLNAQGAKWPRGSVLHSHSEHRSSAPFCLEDWMS